MLCIAILLNGLFFQLELFLNWASNLVFTKPPRICGFLHSAMKILGKKVGLFSKSFHLFFRISFFYFILWIVSSIPGRKKQYNEHMCTRHPDLIITSILSHLQQSGFLLWHYYMSIWTDSYVADTAFMVSPAIRYSAIPARWWVGLKDCLTSGLICFCQEPFTDGAVHFMVHPVGARLPHSSWLKTDG